MIVLEFMGSVIEGENIPFQAGEPLLVFRIQQPITIPYVDPVFNEEPLEHIARVRNRALGRDTSITSEYEVRTGGDLVVTSYMSLDAGPRIFRLGVQELESGILLYEEDPQVVGGYPWFIDGDFVEPNGDGTRSLFCPRYVPPPEGQPALARLLGDDSF